MNALLFFPVHRRLYFQRKMDGPYLPLIQLQSSRTLSSSRNEQDNYTRERRQQSVLLVDEAGANLGETSLEEAANVARKKSLDLVWTNKQSKTAMPVYKMMRKIDIKRKALKSPKTKNIEVSDKIEVRDLSFRLNQIQKWLEKGHQVRVCVKSKGKSEEDKWKIIKKVEQELKEIGIPIGRPSEDSPVRISCIFQPLRECNSV